MDIAAVLGLANRCPRALTGAHTPTCLLGGGGSKGALDFL